MFGRFFSQTIFRRGMPLAAATIGLTKWYSATVSRIEGAVKTLSRYQPIEGESFLHDAIDILKRVEDVNNTEISWRLGRAFVEETVWIPSSTKTIAKKIGLLEDAITLLKKALNNPISVQNAGPHKWYAIALARLYALQKKNKLVQNAENEIIFHLEQAAKIDPTDPFTFCELALNHYSNKNYKMAINNARAAEKIKSEFSNLNLFVLGASLYSDGQKDDGLKFLKRAVSLKPDNAFDNNGWFKAKTFLLTKAKLSAEEVATLTWEY